MNLYFSSVASQQPGHSSLSKMNTNTKHTNNQMNNPTHSCKQHVTLSNALDLFTGNNITSGIGGGIGNRNSFSIAGNNHIRKLEETTPVNIVLRRASNDSPWGFRVQGGSDYHLQLTICKTQSGSPSEGILQSGDEILSINGENARILSHEEATQKIRSAGTDLQLTVASIKFVVNRPRIREMIVSGKIMSTKSTKGICSFLRQTCDLSDIRPKGLLKFTAPQNNRR